MRQTNHHVFILRHRCNGNGFDEALRNDREHKFCDRGLFSTLLGNLTYSFARKSTGQSVGDIPHDS